MTSIITADEGVLYTSHRKTSPEMLINQWLKAEAILLFILVTTTMTIHTRSQEEWARSLYWASHMCSTRANRSQEKLLVYTKVGVGGKTWRCKLQESGPGLNLLAGSTALHTHNFPGSVNCLNVPLRPIIPSDSCVPFVLNMVPGCGQTRCIQWVMQFSSSLCICELGMLISHAYPHARSVSLPSNAEIVRIYKTALE